MNKFLISTRHQNLLGKLSLKSIKSLMALISVAILAVACASGNGSGSGDSGGNGNGSGGNGNGSGGVIDPPQRNIGAFSHSSYTFAAPNSLSNGTSTIITAEPIKIARLLLNLNSIKNNIVAEELGLENPRDIAALSEESGDYQTNLSLVEPADAATADGYLPSRFFGIEDDGNITLMNPGEEELTFADIIKFFPQLTIRLTVSFNVTASAGASMTKKVYTTDVAVDFLNRNALPLETAPIVYNRNFKLGDLFLPTAPTFNLTGNIFENNDLTAGVTLTNIKQSDNLKDGYGLSNRDLNSSATLFYSLSDLGNPNLPCANYALYIDNNDIQIKAGNIFDYETPPTSYNCRLAISQNGIDYRHLAFVLDNKTTEANISGAKVNATNSDEFNNVTLVNQVNGSGTTRTIAQSTCEGENACYYADLQVKVMDANDPPTIELINNTGGNVLSFVGASEGKGAIAPYDKYNTSNEGTLSQPPFRDMVFMRLDDEDVSAKFRNNTINQRVMISPSTGKHAEVASAFKVQVDSANASRYELTIEKSLLDYEAFTSEQLTANGGEAIYKITLTTQDNNDANIKNQATFNFTLTDVRYDPIFVSPTNSQKLLLADDVIFKVKDNIMTGAGGSPIYLLSGINALSRSVLGSFALVDPETGNDDKLKYTIEDASGVSFANQLSLILNPASGGRKAVGRQLVVSSTGLINSTNQGTLTLKATYIEMDGTISTNTNSTAITIQVNDDAYVGEMLSISLATTARITFNRALNLSGAIDENMAAGTQVTLQPALVNAISPDEGAIPYFGFVTDSGLLGDIKNSGISIDDPSGKFEINSSTGDLSISGAEELNFPQVFNLPVYVTAEDDGIFVRTTADVEIVSIRVEDVNTAPTLSAASKGIFNASTNTLELSIKENTPVGTEIVRFNIEDDNDISSGLDITLLASNSSLRVDYKDVLDAESEPTGIVTAIFYLARKINYELPAPAGTAEEEIINIKDSGKHQLTDDFIPLLKQNLLTEASNNQQETTELTISITPVDVVEAPDLKVVSNGLWQILESAGENQFVTLDGGTLDDNVVATINNSASLNFELSGSFAGILDVVSRNVGGRIELRLQVIDADALENLGDGRTFPVYIKASDPDTKLSDEITLRVLITNDPTNSIADLAALINNNPTYTNLSINEQDVVGDTATYIEGFNIKATDIVKDADETINGKPLARVDISLVSTSFSNADLLRPRLNSAKIFVLEEPTGEFGYRLRVGDADFIEEALFGESITITLVNSTAGRGATPVSFNVKVEAANPKRVVYADANGESLGIPVYDLRYTQTDYAAPINNLTNIEATAAADLELDPAKIVGAPLNHINLAVAGQGQIYSTVQLIDAAGVSIDNNFIRRSAASRNDLQGSADKFTFDDSGSQQEILIGFTSAIDLAENIEILKQDATGNLVDASAEFSNYFSYGLISADDRTQINITQKLFSYVSSTDATAHYNALDTLPLFASADTNSSIDLNYFLRARTLEDGNNNASNYALAQFSVAVKAAGLIRLALVPSGASFDPQASDQFFFAGGTRTIVANSIAVNSFDKYDLLVEFSNPDAVAKGEGLPIIDVKVDAGTGPNDLSNQAADGFLIDLRQATSSVTTNPPTSLPVNINHLANNNVSDSLSTSYTARYDFALAQNLHGTAVINIKVTDRDTNGNPLGSISDRSFKLIVDPVTAVVPILHVTTSIGGVNLVNLTEDSGPLETTEVDLSYRLTNISADNLARGLSDGGVTAISLTSPMITRTDDSRHNNLDKKFIEPVVNSNRLRYSRHGWGVQGLTFEYVITEQRGFDLSNISRPFMSNQKLVVAAAPDPTSVTNGDALPGFLARNFTLDNTLTSPTVSRNNIQVSFRDDDLLFDELENVMGDMVTVSGVALSNLMGNASAANGLALQLSTTKVAEKAYALTLLGSSGSPGSPGSPGSTNIAQATIDSYSLTLNQDQLDALLSLIIQKFDIDFNFSPTGTSPATAPFNLSGKASVTFASNLTTATIPDAAIGSVSINEDTTIGYELGRFTVNDGDIDRRLGSGGLTPAQLFTFTFSADVDDFLTTNTTIPSNTTNEAIITITTKRLLNDKDVKSYNPTFNFTDNHGSDGSAITLPSQSFALSVTRADDSPGVTEISFPAANNNSLNTNNNVGDFFRLEVSVADADFLEVQPTQILNNITYDYVDFTLQAPSPSTAAVTCRVSSANASLLLSTDIAGAVYDRETNGTASVGGNLRNGTGGILTLEDIKASSSDNNCNTPQIGSMITGAAFGGVKVASPGSGPGSEGSSPSSVGVNFPAAYVIQGYRQVSPSGMLSEAAVNVSAGGSTMTVTLTVTDGDPDDGTPLTPSPVNAIRNDATASVWQNSPIVTVNSSGCSGGSITATAGNYAAVSGGGNSSSSQAMSSISISASAGTTGSCSVTIAAGEDGQMITPQTIQIQLEEPPMVTITSQPESSYFSRESFSYVNSTGDPTSFDITVSIVDGDADANTKQLAIVSTNPTICSISGEVGLHSFTGNSSEVLLSIIALLPGSCSITISATEDETTATITQEFVLPQLLSIFNIVDGRTFFGVDTIEVGVTLSKSDPSLDTSVTLDSSVTEGDCSVANPTSSNYPTSAPGTTINATYVVTSNNQNRREFCKIVLTAEDAVGSPPSINITLKLFPQDEDGDGHNWAEDVDDDGDKLIEIYTVDQLNMIRNNLAGTGLDSNNSDGNSSSGGNILGCGSNSDAAANPTSNCFGYELMYNLDLLDNPDLSRWEPVGSNSTTSDDAFTGIFEGNDYTISNIDINIASDHKDGIGFFGAIATEVRNLHLKNIDISAPGSENVGGLVGILKENAIVRHSSVLAKKIGGKENVGGLIGATDNNVLVYATAARSNEIGLEASNEVGGLIGVLESGGRVLFSNVTANNIQANNFIGGLIGTIYNNNIIKHNLAEVKTMTNGRTGGNSGGLIGRAFSNNTISFSAGLVNRRIGHLTGGGLIGRMQGNNQVIASLAMVQELSSDVDPAGLIGRIESGDEILASMAIVYRFVTIDTRDGETGGLVSVADTESRIKSSLALTSRIQRNTDGRSTPTFLPAKVGGLIGDFSDTPDMDPRINASYWNANVSYTISANYNNTRGVPPDNLDQGNSTS
ncbi:MAG: cadherin repeat domain-containing protein, partial [Candidatus Portiera sp.]|nr:cadherin repeat domain-containing protein [Portiera sp.]